MADENPRVLVVDDAPEFLELLLPMLTKEGFVVAAAVDGEQGVREARQLQPDIVVLDLCLPGIDGIEVCRQIRTFSDAYVVMLTSRVAEVDRVLGLEVGADDYLTKPFSPRELVARLRAMLRRPRRSGDEQPAEELRELAGLSIDRRGRTVQVQNREVALTRIEFDLLDVLTSSPSTVFSRAILREQVWGPDWYGDDHVVDVHIANLRKKIDPPDGPSRVRTVRGVGYRMELG